MRNKFVPIWCTQGPTTEFLMVFDRYLIDRSGTEYPVQALLPTAALTDSECGITEDVYLFTLRLYILDSL